jgi:hypothetical protein
MTQADLSSGSLPEIELAGAMPLTAWRKAYGIPRTTVWLWRLAGKLKVITRYGHVYVNAEESRRFFSDEEAKPKDRSVSAHSASSASALNHSTFTRLT